MFRSFATVLLALFLMSGEANSSGLAAREGWMVMPTEKNYDDLLKALKSSVKNAKFGLVTEAGPTAAARQRGITIPGNRVIGVFRNDYAVNILKTSTAAMIEAPIRFYVTEAEDGKATLSYKKPTFVFAPYYDEGGEELKRLAGELDVAFEKIAKNAAQ